MHKWGEDNNTRAGKSMDVRKIHEEMLVWPGKLDIGYYSRKKKRSEKGMLVHLPPAMCQALCCLILNITLGLRIVAA